MKQPTSHAFELRPVNGNGEHDIIYLGGDQDYNCYTAVDQAEVVAFFAALSDELRPSPTPNLDALPVSAANANIPAAQRAAVNLVTFVAKRTPSPRRWTLGRSLSSTTTAHPCGAAISTL